MFLFAYREIRIEAISTVVLYSYLHLLRPLPMIAHYTYFIDFFVLSGHNDTTVVFHLLIFGASLS